MCFFFRKNIRQYVIAITRVASPRTKQRNRKNPFKTSSVHCTNPNFIYGHIQKHVPRSIDGPATFLRTVPSRCLSRVRLAPSPITTVQTRDPSLVKRIRT